MLDNSKKYFRQIGIILIAFSVLFFIGLSSYWEFEVWRVIDWIVIIFNLIGGIYLVKKSK
jgi:hypothetical protein